MEGKEKEREKKEERRVIDGRLPDRGDKHDTAFPLQSPSSPQNVLREKKKRKSGKAPKRRKPPNHTTNLRLALD